MPVVAALPLVLSGCLRFTHDLEPRTLLGWFCPSPYLYLNSEFSLCGQYSIFFLFQVLFCVSSLPPFVASTVFFQAPLTGQTCCQQIHHGTHFTPRSWVNTSLRAIIMHVRRKDEWWCLCAALFNILDHTKTASRRCWKGTIRVHLSLALVTQQS